MGSTEMSCVGAPAPQRVLSRSARANGHKPSMACGCLAVWTGEWAKKPYLHVRIVWSNKTIGLLCTNLLVKKWTCKSESATITQCLVTFCQSSNDGTRDYGLLDSKGGHDFVGVA